MWPHVLRPAFALATVTIGALGSGVWIYNLLPLSFRTFERTTIVLLGGFGFLSSVLFIVGQISFTRTCINSILLVASILGIFSVKRIWADKTLLTGKTARIPRAAVVVVGSVLVLTAISGLAEITGDWSSDAVSYHLLGPKVWLREGVIRPVLDNSHTAFPQIVETLFAALWSLGGSQAPNFSSSATFGLLLAAAASLAIRLGLSDAEAWWVATIVATMPAVYTGSHGCFVDGIFATFLIAATRIGLDAQTVREWVVFGLFCGFAIGTKYTGLIAVPILIACILLLKLQDHPSPDLAKKVATSIGVACLIGSPYYIRNWALLGSPIYPPPPGYAPFFSPKYLSPEAISQFHAYIRQRGAGLGRGLLAFLLLPFNLTYHTSNFHGAGGIGLCPFALGPIGILSSRKNTELKVMVILAFLLTLSWFTTQQESRFLIYVYVLGAVFAVFGWRAVMLQKRRLSRCLGVAVLVISCSYGLFMIVRGEVVDVKALVSPGVASWRRETAIPFLHSFEYLNHEDSVRSVLILDRSVMPYYSDKRYVKPVGQWFERTLPGGPDSKQALTLTLKHTLDASHVLDVNSEESSYQVAPGTPGLTLVFEAKDQRVYRVD